MREPEKNPETILASVERLAFGASGCGIDWQKADTKAAADDPDVTGTLYYGDICICWRVFAAMRLAVLLS